MSSYILDNYKYFYNLVKFVTRKHSRRTMLQSVSIGLLGGLSVIGKGSASGTVMPCQDNAQILCGGGSGPVSPPTSEVDTWEGTCYVNPSLYSYKGHHCCNVDHVVSETFTEDFARHVFEISSRAEFGRWNKYLDDGPEDAGHAPYIEGLGVNISNFDFDGVGRVLLPSAGNSNNEETWLGTSFVENEDADDIDADEEKVAEVLQAAFGAAPVIGDALDYYEIVDALLEDHSSSAGYDFRWAPAEGGTMGSGGSKADCTVRFVIEDEDPGQLISGTTQSTVWTETPHDDDWDDNSHTHEFDLSIVAPPSSSSLSRDELTSYHVEEVDRTVDINGEELNMTRRYVPKTRTY